VDFENDSPSPFDKYTRSLKDVLPTVGPLQPVLDDFIHPSSMHGWDKHSAYGGPSKSSKYLANPLTFCIGSYLQQSSRTSGSRSYMQENVQRFHGCYPCMYWTPGPKICHSDY